MQTGTPLKQLDLDITAQLEYDFRCFFLNRPRVQLFRRIDQRCCDMLAGGLLQVRSPQSKSPVLVSIRFRAPLCERSLPGLTAWHHYGW